ncbi:MAG: sulfurtransferase TusA family protein [Marinilabiliales bacterium]|nr:sulfurtransferase TusA family protein [Marinilabiliales bacterium]
MKVVDTRGLTCPAPLIMTRQGLTEVSCLMSLFRSIIDNKTSLE